MRASVKPKCIRKKAGGRLPSPICPDRRGMANPKHHGLRWQGAARHRYRPRQGFPPASPPSPAATTPYFLISAVPCSLPITTMLSPQSAQGQARHSTVPRTRQRLGKRWPATAFPLRASNRNVLPPVTANFCTAPQKLPKHLAFPQGRAGTPLHAVVTNRNASICR